MRLWGTCCAPSTSCTSLWKVPKRPPGVPVYSLVLQPRSHRDTQHMRHTKPRSKSMRSDAQPVTDPRRFAVGRWDRSFPTCVTSVLDHCVWPILSLSLHPAQNFCLSALVPQTVSSHPDRTVTDRLSDRPASIHEGNMGGTWGESESARPPGGGWQAIIIRPHPSPCRRGERSPRAVGTFLHDREACSLGSCGHCCRPAWGLLASPSRRRCWGAGHPIRTLRRPGGLPGLALGVGGSAGSSVPRPPRPRGRQSPVPGSAGLSPFFFNFERRWCEV